MNKKIYLLPLLLLALIFVSCEETKEATKFDNWRARNEGYIDSLKTVFDESFCAGNKSEVTNLL